jgi:formiminoglutamase
MPGFHFYSKEELAALVVPRPGETKLGQMIDYGGEEMTSIAGSKARFVLLGLPEDIGVRANGGIGGADTAWVPFLRSFLQIQETRLLSGKDFLVLGHLDISERKSSLKDASIGLLRTATATIDDLVGPVIRLIIEAGKIPIVIGGGHNNAFPMLKGASDALNGPLNAINLDAHADFRPIEGRHSGNGFRYAYESGYLKKYAALGLHEAYNNREMIAVIQENKDLMAIFWEDLFLRNTESWEHALKSALNHVSDIRFGVELDVDCIENVLSSAATPVGISPREAMAALYQCGKHKNAIYLHLPEAIAMRHDGSENPLAGKLLSYLVQAFAKGVLER